jgi:preprotein translocase SecE subunit
MASLVTRTREFGGEVAEELRKVTWPDVGQLRQATIVILIFVFIVAMIILFMDTVIRQILNLIMTIFT